MTADELRLVLAEEAEQAAAYLVADAVVRDRPASELTLLAAEFRRAQADLRVAVSVFEAPCLDHRATA